MLRRINTSYKTKVVRAAAAASGAKNNMALLQIIRWDPSTNTQRVESYEFQKKQDFMVLDLLTAVKAHQDPSLAFRASCCEGVCGSCTMNINGVNSLACITYASQHTIVGPLPNFPVIKDLVVDLRHFFKQYEFIRPFVRNINLNRAHVDHIVERYNKTRHAIYGRDSKAIAAHHDGHHTTTAARSFGEAYRALLDKAAAAGDVSATIEVLGRINRYTELDNAFVAAKVKEALKNYKASA